MTIAVISSLLYQTERDTIRFYDMRQKEGSKLLLMLKFGGILLLFYCCLFYKFLKPLFHSEEILCRNLHFLILAAYRCASLVFSSTPMFLHIFLVDK